jgi:hypothetical protein
MALRVGTVRFDGSDGAEWQPVRFRRHQRQRPSRSVVAGYPAPDDNPSARTENVWLPSLEASTPGFFVDFPGDFADTACCVGSIGFTPAIGRPVA